EGLARGGRVRARRGGARRSLARGGDLRGGDALGGSLGAGGQEKGSRERDHATDRGEFHGGRGSSGGRAALRGGPGTRRALVTRMPPDGGVRRVACPSRWSVAARRGFPGDRETIMSANELSLERAAARERD